MSKESILFVGDKPSTKNIDPELAFIGTKSYGRLLGWIQAMGIKTKVSFVNRVQDNFEREIILALIEGRPIIALGRNAEKAISKIISDKDRFFVLPHPSGLNRQNNDRMYVFSKLLACCGYLHRF